MGSEKSAEGIVGKGISLTEGLNQDKELEPLQGQEYKQNFNSIHPYMLRHSAGFKLANDGRDMRTI